MVNLQGFLDDLVKVRKTREIREVDLVDTLLEYMSEDEVTDEIVEKWSELLFACPSLRVITAKEEDAPIYLSASSTSMMIHQAAMYPLLDLPTERDLGVRMRNGDKDARDLLVCHNLRLVISIAKKHQNKGLDLNDLIQAGNEGLIKAVDKYDPHRISKLSTMATWWIRQSIMRAIATSSRSIKVPDYMHHITNKVNRGQAEFIKQHGYTPTDQELANFLGEKIHHVEAARKVSSQTPCSLETPVGDEGDTTLMEFIGDSSKESDVFGSVMTPMLSEELRDILNEMLSPRELDVVSLRFGFKDGNIRTLEQVGKQFGITRERVRQIEMKAFKKLRNPAIYDRMYEYMRN